MRHSLQENVAEAIRLANLYLDSVEKIKAELADPRMKFTVYQAGLKFALDCLEGKR